MHQESTSGIERNWHFQKVILQPHGLYSPWNFPGQNTRVDSLSLLQRIFQTQGSNPGLLRYRQIFYQLSYKGSQHLEWVAYPFSSGSSWPRNRAQLSCTAGRFFTNWAIREAHYTQVYLCHILDSTCKCNVYILKICLQVKTTHRFQLVFVFPTLTTFFFFSHPVVDSADCRVCASPHLGPIPV